MVTFHLQNGVVATLRTSGTEPKIKFYTEFCAAPGQRSAVLRQFPSTSEKMTSQREFSVPQ